MSAITTHVLDTSRGRPAADVPVTLEIESAGGWKVLGKGTTNADGRVTDLMSPEAQAPPGVYRLIFDTSKYFAGHDTAAFYPQVTVVFRIEDRSQHYHVPLLLSPFGYSTYRGS
jgi:5-hydroxyisourate hydrolase